MKRYQNTQIVKRKACCLTHTVQSRYNDTLVQRTSPYNELNAPPPHPVRFFCQEKSCKNLYTTNNLRYNELSLLQTNLCAPLKKQNLYITN